VNPNPHRQYRFADFLVDETRGALLRGDEEIPLRKQAYEMLVILVEHRGQLVDKDYLLDTIWGEAVVTENSVTQCLKEIRRAIGDADLTMIRTIPKRGYIFELPVKTIETDASSVIGAGATHSRWWLLGAAAVLIITAVAWWALDNSPPAETVPITDATPPPQNSLAVLPFTNMSPDSEISFLADGISEEILNQLAQIPGLLVIARTSSFTFRDSDVDIATIGRRLNVAHVLEGSVRVEDDTARVTVQLVSTDNQAHLWSRIYDRPLDGIFDLQKGIARDVAQHLHFQLTDAGDGDSQRAHKPGAESYEAYLRGQYLMAQRTPASMAGAVGEFRKAVELDPDYAAAQAGLALATRFQTETQYGDLPKAEALARARPHAERALELDPTLAEAHAAMAYVLVTWETMEQALFHFRRAIALNPNYADAAMWLSKLLEQKGEYGESFELLELAVRSDPLSVIAMRNYALALQARGRLGEAERVHEKLASLAPSHYRELTIVFRSRNGQWAEAALTALKAKLEEPTNSELDTEFAVRLAAMGMDENALALTHVQHLLVFELLGRPNAVARLYEQLQTERPLSTAQEFFLGYALAAAGEFERALPYLEDNWAHMDGLVSIPWFDARSVLALIGARRASGEETGSKVLIAALQESVRRYRDAGMVNCNLSRCIDFEAAIAAYLSGERQSAVNLLISAVDHGHLIPPNFAFLQFLYDDPALVPVFERQRAHVLAERQEFLQAICPHNPYARVWQPVDGTCETDIGEHTAAMWEPNAGR
jgi:TolB-like protein/DNA-binding winged helix-turn-helix (wHTH) protein